VLFLRSHLNKGLYYGYKGKGYATEVVTIAKKLLLDDLKDINNGLGKAQKLAGRQLKD